MIAKSKRSEAERAGEWYLRERCGCVMTRKAVRTKWQSQDFFGSDIMGKRPGGACVYAQVTAGGNEALRVRRRKLEAVPWHPSERVMVLQLTSTPDPARASRKLWWFRVHYYNHRRGVWGAVWATPVDKAWFKAYGKTEKKQEDK